jgi:uncharacterized membrane protein YfcA
VSASSRKIGRTWGAGKSGLVDGPLSHTNLLAVKLALFIALAGFAATYLIVWASRLRGEHRPGWRLLAVGAVTNFFDTLGIGSFATTTALYKVVPDLRRIVPDRLIPGTLNVGHTLPAILQAFIFIAIIAVDVRTLVAIIAAAVAGAWLGAGRVAKWNKQTVRVVMGVALIVAASLMAAAQLGLVPAGGDALGLGGARLGVAIAASSLLGALMTMGIGYYGPCMIMVSLLGMNPRTAFPIMMGACAFLMPVASMRFVRAQAYEPRAALGLALGGIPAVLVAAFVVKSLPLGAVRWLVVVVVLYAATLLLAAAVSERRVGVSRAALEEGGAGR